MNKLLKYWIDIIGLNDWTIKLKENCFQSELQIQNVCGETEWEEVSKSALIKIISEEEYGNRIVKYDFEQILVHELLHLKFCLLGESGNYLQDRLVHRYIDDMAKSLIKAKRTKTV